MLVPETKCLKMMTKCFVLSSTRLWLPIISMALLFKTVSLQIESDSRKALSEHEKALRVEKIILFMLRDPRIRKYGRKHLAVNTTTFMCAEQRDL